MIIVCDSPFAVNSITLMHIEKQYGDGLLRTSTGCTDPSCSRILYVDWLKLTVIATEKQPTYVHNRAETTSY